MKAIFKLPAVMARAHTVEIQLNSFSFNLNEIFRLFCCCFNLSPFNSIVSAKLPMGSLIVAKYSICMQNVVWYNEYDFSIFG